MNVPVPQATRHYGNVYISGQAKVQLGDAYAANRDLFESGTEDERQEGKRTVEYLGSRQQLTVISFEKCACF